VFLAIAHLICEVTLDVKYLDCLIQKATYCVQWDTIHLRTFSFTVKEKFIAANFDTPQGLKNWFFVMKFFLEENLYVNNICAKFQGQKIYTKRDIQSLPTCVVVNFHCSQLCHLLKD